MINTTLTLDKAPLVKLEVIALMPPKYTVDVILLCGVKKIVVYPFTYQLHNVPLFACKFFSTWAEVEAYYQ